MRHPHSIILFVLAAVGVSALAACGSPSPDDVYLGAVRSDGHLARFSDDQLLQLGKSNCATLGGPVGNAIDWRQQTVDMGMTDIDRGVITNAAVLNYCPQYKFALSQ